MPIKRMIALVTALVVLVGLFFWQPVSRFLFHPDGLSLASGEICMENASGETIIAEIAVLNGAKTIELLGAGESACSPSAHSKANGTIRVSKSERGAPFCERTAASGINNILTRFAPPDNCEWQA